MAIKQASFMLDYNYYDNLRKASIVPEHIRKMFEDNSKTGKIYVEMYLPFIRVANYAVTNEPKLFSDLLKKMKNAKKLPPYFHRRMLYKELYRSLVLLGDECLTCLLSELDCSDLVLNGLHDSVINHDSDAFEKVMQGWDGSFSQVTPICRLLSLELFFNDAFERIVKEENRIDEITDLNQQNQEIQAFGRKVIDVFNMKAKDIFNDAFDDGSDKRLEKTFDECLDEALKFAIDSRELDEVGYDFYKKGFMLVSIVADPNVEIPEKAPKDFFYKVLLIAYGYLVTETSISRSAKRVIEETLFVPEYEAIWKQYQDLGFIDYIKKEEFNLKVKTQPTSQIEEPVKEEVKGVPKKPQKIAQQTDKETWRLQQYLCREQKLDEKTKLPYCKGFKKSIVEAGDDGDRALTKFIQYLADHEYIDDNKITKNSFAYALTGRGHFRTGITKVEWHHEKDDTRKVPESVRVLLYISSNLFDSDNKKGKTYSQLFDVLNAGPNPCIKDGKDQSSAYYDKVSEDFKKFFNDCFGRFTKDFDKKNQKK